MSGTGSTQDQSYLTFAVLIASLAFFLFVLTFVLCVWYTILLYRRRAAVRQQRTGTRGEETGGNVPSMMWTRDRMEIHWGDSYPMRTLQAIPVVMGASQPVESNELWDGADIYGESEYIPRNDNNVGCTENIK